MVNRLVGIARWMADDRLGALTAAMALPKDMTRALIKTLNMSLSMSPKLRQNLDQMQMQMQVMRMNQENPAF